MNKKSETINLRIRAELKKKLEMASIDGPYRLTMTSIIERGIELALREIHEMRLERGRS